MKKITLVLAALLLSVTSAKATEQVSELDGKDLRVTKRYRFSQPIMFVERGVEFLIFQNGEFDFNTDSQYGFSDNYYRKHNSRNRGYNKTYGAPGVHVKYNRSRGVYIAHDRFGRVRRIGNVFVNYDAYGRVKRVGSVYMRYRHNKLKQVGGLYLQYNRWGDMIDIRGNVNFSNQGCGFCGMTGCTTNHFHNDGGNNWYNDNDWSDNDDYYYYRKNGKTHKKSKKQKKYHKKRRTY